MQVQVTLVLNDDESFEVRTQDGTVVATGRCRTDDTHVLGARLENREIMDEPGVAGPVIQRWLWDGEQASALAALIAVSKHVGEAVVQDAIADGDAWKLGL